MESLSQELQVQPGVEFISSGDQGNGVDSMGSISMATGGAVSSNLQQFAGLPPQSDEALQDISAAMGMFSPQLSLQGLSQANPNSIALQRQQQQQQQLMLQQHQQLAMQQQQQQFAFQQQQQMALNGLQNSQMRMQMPLLQMGPQSNGLAAFPGNQLGLTELGYQQLMMNPNMQQAMNLAQFRGAPGGPGLNLQSLQASGGLKTQQLPQMSLPGDTPRPSVPGTSIPPSMPPADHEAQLAASILDQYGAKGTKEPPFPLKLHQILSNPDYQECICWLPHGRSWRILKPSSFEQVVIPLYFRHAKYASFMRQVNGWGFKRVRMMGCSFGNGKVDG
jgi:hypothetical protein